MRKLRTPHFDTHLTSHEGACKGSTSILSGMPSVCAGADRNQTQRCVTHVFWWRIGFANGHDDLHKAYGDAISI